MVKILGFLLLLCNLVIFSSSHVQEISDSTNISPKSGNDLLTDEENKSSSNEIEKDIVKDQLLNQKTKEELLTAEAKQKRGLSCCGTAPGLGSNRYPSERYPSERYPSDRYPGDRYGGRYLAGLSAKNLMSVFSSTGGGGGHDYPSGYGSGGAGGGHSGPSGGGGGYGNGYSFGHSTTGGGGGGLYRPYQPSGGGHSYYDSPVDHGGSYGHDDGYHGNEGGGGIFDGNQKSYALKKLLLPLAGLAIVGVAAAISQNPVLLQLGTLKGRKRRSVLSQENEEMYRSGKIYPGNPKVRPLFGPKRRKESSM